MKILKKTISIFLAFVLALSFGGVLAAEETVAVEVNEKELTALNSLKALGLSDTDVTDPNAYITREEIANVAANMLGFDKEHAGTGIETNIIDVDSSPYCAQIKTLAAFGIISGVNPYQFFPEGTVRYTEAIKILVSVLGYGEEAYARGGYPGGYIKMASLLGISSKIVEDSQKITWGEFAVLVNDCYEIPIQTIKSVGSHVTYSQEDKNTFLSQYLDIVKIKGTITDNGFTARNGETEVGSNNIKIEGNVVAKGNTDIETAMGEYLECYCKSEEGKLTALYYTIRKNDKKLVIEANALEEADIDEISYNDNGKIKSVNISPNADVIYNGAAYPDFDDELLSIENGKMTLYDDKADKGYDLIVIEEFEAFVVSSDGLINDIETGFFLESGKNTLTGTLGEKVDLKDYESYYIYNENHEEIELGDIKAGCVASVYASLSNELCRVVITNKTALGEISSIVTEDDTFYYIGEEAYKLNHSFKKKLENNVIGAYLPELGVSYTLYLDIEGNIAGVNPSVSGTQYVYLTKADNKKESVFEDEVTYMRVATATSGFATLKTAKKLTLNYSEEKILGKDLANIPEFYDEEGNFKPQLVEIEVDSKGDVVALNTATTTLNTYGYNQEKFSRDYKTTRGYWRNGTKAFDGYTIKSGSPIFMVPESMEEEEFDALIPNQMNTRAEYYDIELYDFDASLAAKAAVIYTNEDSILYENDLLFVEEVRTVREADGEMHMRIRGFVKNTHVEYSELVPGYLASTLGSVKQGDVLRIALKSGKTMFNIKSYVANNKAIVRAEKLFSISDFGEKAAGKVPFEGAADNDTIAYGPIYSRTSSATTIITNTAGTEITKAPLSTTCGYVIYDVEAGTFTPVTYDQITSSSVVYADGSADLDWDNIIVVQTNNGMPAINILVKR